ncbi:MAG: PIN domain-containing protein [Planctomycetota bacterium]
MLPAPFRVVLDANVLYPFTLRDTILRAGARGMVQVYWSEQILEEVRRNLVEAGVASEHQAERLLAAMRRAFPEATVRGHEPLVAAMPNQEKDRHVAAAAVKAGAPLIVTLNLRDFASLPDGVEAQGPDEFLESLFDLDPDGMVELVVEQAGALKRPPRSVDEVLRALEKTVPVFARSVRQRRSEAGG